MKAKLFVVLSLLALTAFLVGAVSAQGPALPGPPPPSEIPPAPEEPLARSAVAGMSTAQGQAQNVALISQIGGATYAVAVQGHTAYIGVGPRLVILDISNSASPALLGRTDLLPGVAEDVAVAGSYAYVVAGEAGLRIVDVSDPAHPTEIGAYDTPGSARGVAVTGNYAYVADWDGGLRILDVSDPAYITETGFYDTPGIALEVTVAGSYAYVADGGGGLVTLLSVPYRLSLPLVMRN